MPLKYLVLWMRRSDESSIVKLENITKEQLDRWKQLWLTNTDANLFNSIIWLEASQKAFAHRNQLVVIAQADDSIGAVILLEKRGNTWVLMGRPYMDRASLLLDRNFMSEYGHQLVTILLEKCQVLDFSELSENQHEILLSVSDNLLVCSRKSSLNPRFRIGKPALTSKEKREINRLTRRLNKQGDWSIELQSLDEDSFTRMLFIEQSSHKVQDSQAILHKPGIKELLTCIGSFSKAYAIFLVHNNKDIAHLLGLVEGDTFLAYHMAYHKEWANCAPGKLLVYHSLSQLENAGFVYFDFSRGESVTKAKFSSINITLYGLSFFERSCKGCFYYFLCKIDRFLDSLRVKISSHLPIKWKEKLRSYFNTWLDLHK